MSRVKVTVVDGTQVNDDGTVRGAGESFETDEDCARTWESEGLVTVARVRPAKRVRATRA